MDLFRGVGPRKKCEAASPERYASVSTILPTALPPGISRTTVLPIRYRASLTVFTGSSERRSLRIKSELILTWFYHTLAEECRFRKSFWCEGSKKRGKFRDVQSSFQVK